MHNALSTETAIETFDETSLISAAELENKIRMLSPTDQKVLASYIKGYTVTEIANAMNLPARYITETINQYLRT